MCAGADLLDGGEGIDRGNYLGASAGVTVDLTNPANNTGDAAGDSYVSIEVVLGSNFNDTLTGDAGDNRLQGRDGDDVVSGLDGEDRLEGEAGNDTIIGGSGKDTLLGGTGADTFVFTNITDSPGGGSFDTIEDFVVGEDHLDLSSIDADISSGIDDAFVFSGETNTVQANSVTWYQDGSNTIVQADVNGDAAADMMVVLLGLKSLTSGDFLL